MERWCETACAVVNYPSDMKPPHTAAEIAAIIVSWGLYPVASPETEQMCANAAARSLSLKDWRRAVNVR